MLKGVYTALITPLDENLMVDWKGLEELLYAQIEAKVDGVMILGTTGEAPTLSSHEQEAIIKLSVKILKNKLTLYVGTGSYNTAETILKTLKSKDLGADGALIVTPYYNKPTQEGLYQHFRAIAKETGFPILVYNIQGRTGQNLATDTLKKLVEIPEIIGVKEASGNIAQMMDVLEIGRPEFSVLSGDDNLILPLMALGGHGIVSVASNLIPKEIKELVTLCENGDFEKARKKHFEWLPIFKSIFIETNPSPIKYLMQLNGLPAGSVRLPLVPLTQENQQQLEAIWSTVTLTL